MKKLFSIALAFTLVLGLVPVSAFAVETETSNVTKQQVSDVYGIPMSVLDTLDEDTYNSLSEQISDALNISSGDTYVKISYTESGDSIITESTYQDFLVSSLLSRVSGTDENSWLRIHTTIVDKGSYAQVSAAYTWLTNNIMAAYDIIGLGNH